MLKVTYWWTQCEIASRWSAPLVNSTWRSKSKGATRRAVSCGKNCYIYKFISSLMILRIQSLPWVPTKSKKSVFAAPPPPGPLSLQDPYSEVHTCLVPRYWLGTVYAPHWVVECKTLHFPSFGPKAYSSQVGGIVILPEIRRTRRVWLMNERTFMSAPVSLVSCERKMLDKGSMKRGVIRTGENPAANLFSWSPPLVCIVGKCSSAIWKEWADVSIEY